MPTLCQSLKQLNDPRYRRDWRVVTYRAEWSDGVLKWRMLYKDKWRGPRWQPSLGMRLPGRSRAARDLDPAVCVFDGVAHGDKVTPGQAKKIAIKMKALDKTVPAAIAMDWLRELDHPHYGVDAVLTPDQRAEWGDADHGGVS